MKVYFVIWRTDRFRQQVYRSEQEAERFGDAIVKECGEFYEDLEAEKSYGPTGCRNVTWKQECEGGLYEGVVIEEEEIQIVAATSKEKADEMFVDYMTQLEW